jgi:hypothetical protein
MLVKPRTSQRTSDVHAYACRETIVAFEIEDSSAGPRDRPLIAKGDLVTSSKSNGKIVGSSGSSARTAERAKTTSLSNASTRRRVDTQSQAAAASPSPEFEVIIIIIYISPFLGSQIA